MAKVIINGSSATRYFPEHPERFTTFIVDLHPLLETDEIVDVSELEPKLFRAIQHRHLDGRGVCKDVDAYFSELQEWVKGE